MIRIIDIIISLIVSCELCRLRSAPLSARTERRSQSTDKITMVELFRLPLPAYGSSCHITLSEPNIHIFIFNHQYLLVVLLLYNDCSASRLNTLHYRLSFVSSQQQQTTNNKQQQKYKIKQIENGDNIPIFIPCRIFTPFPIHRGTGYFGPTGYCFRSISLFVWMYLSVCLSFFVSLLARLRLNGWTDLHDFQGRCRVTMRRPAYIFGQFRETTRCRDAQHGDGVCCVFAPQLV